MMLPTQPVSFSFFFSSRRRHTRCSRDWSSDVCSSDLVEGGVAEPWQLPVGADLVEALLHAELSDEAIGVLDHLEEMAQRRERTSVLAAVARCRGLLAPADSFADFFRCALAIHDGAPTPFERARTELCFGERLRRARLRNEAREHLRAAVDTFEALG